MGSQIVIVCALAAGAPSPAFAEAPSSSSSPVVEEPRRTQFVASTASEEPGPAPPNTETPPKGEIARVQRVAVTDLGVDGVEARVARLFSSRKLERTSVLGLDEIKALLDLEAERQLMGCTAESSCLAEIADALGADVVVLGTIARVGDSHVISLKSVLQGDAAAQGTFNKVVPAGEREELLAEIASSAAASTTASTSTAP